MKFFFDNCISPAIPNCLKALGVDGVALREAFPSSIDDVTLFRQLPSLDSNLVYLTADMHQLTRKEEARELKKCGCTALFFGPFFGKLGMWKQAAWVVTKWPQIDGFCSAIKKGTIGDVGQNGKIRPMA